MHEYGHFSATKTEAAVRREYWIPELRVKVEKVVRNCVLCIQAERKQGKAEGWLNPIEKGCRPMDTYSIDHLGPLATTKKSYKHLFVGVDAFTKFTWLYPTKSTCTAEVLQKLRLQAVTFGNPRRIVSDRGTAFTSGDFEAYCRDQGIKHQLTTTGVPRANGQVERVTAWSSLTKLAAPEPGNWFKFVETAQQCLNVTTHRSTGASPFHVMFGTSPRVRSWGELPTCWNES